MNLPEKIRTKPDLQDPSNQHSETTAKSTSVMRILRLVLPVVIAGAALCLSAGSPVFAKAGHQSDAKETSAIDPAAMEALNKMGA